MKKILQISIAFLCGVVAIQAQNLEKRISPATGSDIATVTTLERLSGAGFSAGDRVYDTNLEASYQYNGNGKWMLLSGAGDGSTGIASSSFGLPSLNAAQINLQNAGDSENGGIFTGAGDIATDNGNRTGIISIRSGAIDNGKLAGNSVTTDKIVDGSVTNSKIGSGINGSKLSNSSVGLDKLNASGFNDGVLGIFQGALGVISANKVYSAVSTNAASDSMVVGQSYATVNHFSRELTLSNNTTLEDLGLSNTDGLYSNIEPNGGEIVLHVIANVNFKRNANDTGERTAVLEILDNDPDGDGDFSDAVVTETVSLKTVKGTVVADYPVSLEGTFKLAYYSQAEVNGTGGNSFRIRVKSGISDATSPVYIGGRNSADNISIVRLQ